MEPTGSKDPFALRRAANGIVKILAETELPLTLLPVVQLSAKDEATADKMFTFFRERVGFYLRDVRGQAYDVVAAVIGDEHQGGYMDVRDSVARAEAVSAARGGEDFAAVSAAFKRIKNILAQAKYEAAPGGFLLREAEGPEFALMQKVYSVVEQLADLREQRDYSAALAAIATIRPEVDAFFERVMVMDPDLVVRERRLLLLSTIVRNFSGIADFSEIVTAG